MNTKINEEGQIVPDTQALAEQGRSVLDVLNRNAEQAPYRPGFLNLKVNRGSKSFEAGALGTFDAPVDCIILAIDHQRSLWPQGSDDVKDKMREWCGRRPLCSSRGNGGVKGEMPKAVDKQTPKNIKDLLQPPMDENCLCGTPRKPKCKWNTFGTAESGDGKACKESRKLLLYMPGISSVAVTRVTAASLSAWRAYEDSMPGQRVDGCLTSIGLTVQTKGVNTYSVMDFSPVKEEGAIVPVKPEMVASLGRVVDYEGRQVQEIEAILEYFGQLEIVSEEEEEETTETTEDIGVPFDEDDKKF